MSLHRSTTVIQRALPRSAVAQNRGTDRAWTCPQRIQALQRYALYSTNSHNNTPPHTSTSVDTARSKQSDGRFLGWVRRLSLISVSAAAGALAYSRVEPVDMGGFSSMPRGKIQPSVLVKEEPDEFFPTGGRAAAEKTKEITRSVLLEAQMQELELVHEYKNKVKEGDWKEADPYWYLTKATEPHHLTAGSLRGENMLSVAPLKFERKDKKAIVLFMHLGRSLCGHDRIIHGGLLATVLDEATGMVALPNLPFHVGFTANLNINYRKPVKADQFVMVKAEFEKSEGRKGYTKASIHDLHGNTLTECTALFISPKNPVGMVAKYVKNSLGL
ncbi:hypothetical protein BGZ80_002141 [Entomortierella chlamydospora]|uniref:Thioesterase domain-containing protein n=1 Tax=Entomortierella chlamydospora TaxID=101097 RepID=A0A9P6T339_9FUNG|nr:hypothetical protein BGZ79_010014 [Entomortierella chlamydospora]KAG0021566.1 hypothetical protein BGZ80_002141 [Entomortierella chlamydospora]